MKKYVYVKKKISEFENQETVQSSRRRLGSYCCVDNLTSVIPMLKPEREMENFVGNPRVLYSLIDNDDFLFYVFNCVPRS